MNYLGINKESIKPVAIKMNELLANYHVYYQNLRSFHWHVEGRNFYDLHAVFEDLYNEAKVNIDDIAERILTVRYKPIGKFSMYLEMSSVTEVDDMMRDDQMVDAVLENHGKLIQIMREIIELAAKVEDEGTIDLIGGFIRNIEKKSWMLDAWRNSVFDKTSLMKK